MKYTRLGDSGLKVSRLCLGTNNFGAQLDAEATAKVIAKSVDVGINFIDTANIYTGGRSEELIGKSLQGNRDSLVIATKVGYGVTDGPNMSGLSRKHILRQVEESLRRLQTDHIDLYYLHVYDDETELGETLRTMDDLVRRGKVSYFGISNFTPAQLRKALAICVEGDLELPIALQPMYNLFEREPEAELLPSCREKGIGVVTYSPLMGGLLTGKYRRGQPPPKGSRGDANPRYWDRISKGERFAAMERLNAVADEATIPLGTLALAWILKNPDVTAPIVGASLPEQVEENCRVLELDVPAEVFLKLESSAVGA